MVCIISYELKLNNTFPNLCQFINHDKIIMQKWINHEYKQHAFNFN